MSLTVVKGLQSEIFVPITPPSVWTPVTKELKDMSIALATAAGVHKKSQERFNLAGDFTWRKIDHHPSGECSSVSWNTGNPGRSNRIVCGTGNNGRSSGRSHGCVYQHQYIM